MWRIEIDNVLISYFNSRQVSCYCWESISKYRGAYQPPEDLLSLKKEEIFIVHEEVANRVNRNRLEINFWHCKGKRTSRNTNFDVDLSSSGEL